MEEKMFNSESRMMAIRVTMSYLTIMKAKKLGTDRSDTPSLTNKEAKFFNDSLEQCVYDWTIVPEYLPTIIETSKSYTYMNGILLLQKGKERLMLLYDGSFAEVDLENYKPIGIPKKITRTEAVTKYVAGQSKKLSNLIDSTLNAINKSIAVAYREEYGDRSGQDSEPYTPR